MLLRPMTDTLSVFVEKRKKWTNKQRAVDAVLLFMKSQIRSHLLRDLSGERD